MQSEGNSMSLISSSPDHCGPEQDQEAGYVVLPEQSQDNQIESIGRLTMDGYLDHLHEIIWKHGSNGRILMGTLNDPAILQKLGETVVRPPEAQGKGKLIKVLEKYGKGQFEINNNRNGTIWVRSLRRRKDAISLASGSEHTDIEDTSSERNGSQTYFAVISDHRILKEYIGSLCAFVDISIDCGKDMVSLVYLHANFGWRSSCGILTFVEMEQIIEQFAVGRIQIKQTDGTKYVHVLPRQVTSTANKSSSDEASGNIDSGNTKIHGDPVDISKHARKTFRNEKTTCYLIDDNQGLKSVLVLLNRYINSVLSDASSDDLMNVPIAAMDCEGVPKDLQLFQIAIPDIHRDGKVLVFLIDCQRIGADIVCEKLRPFLSAHENSPNLLVKLFHDVHNDARAISKVSERKQDEHGIDNNVDLRSSSSSISLDGVLDTQILAEFLMNNPFVGLNAMLKNLELSTHPSKEFFHGRMKSGVDLWTERPIARQALEYAALDASLLLGVAKKIRKVLKPRDFEKLISASRQRVLNAISSKDDHQSSRSICFDMANDHRLVSSELMQATRPNDGFFGEPLRVQSDADEVLDILPQKFKRKFLVQKPFEDDGTDIEQTTSDPNVIKNIVNFIARPSRSRRDMDEGNGENSLHDKPAVDVDRLSDIVLDVGRRPQCWVDDRRIFMSDREDEVVNQNDIDEVCTNLGRFGSDNRAGLSGKLHRFSRMLDRENNITGITVRVGRHVDGNAAMLMDFLKSSDKSILILGEPGSGKTTIVREATRKLAEDKNVIVVDTSNEIAGDGTMPHPCIGLARRMMVPSLDKQSSVMVECVQNHTPHVMVIDEIGRPKEVQAARTVKQRGVRMIASAHGSFRKLLKNNDLNGLIGGIEHVTMGDEMAKDEAKRKQKLASKQQDSENGSSPSDKVSKTKVQRSSEPTFEVVVEVQRGSRNEWRVIADSARAVDQILDGLNYKAQLRIRDPASGTMRLAFVDG